MKYEGRYDSFPLNVWYPTMAVKSIVCAPDLKCRYMANAKMINSHEYDQLITECLLC